MNTKGMSNSGAIHLFLSGSQVVAACASGKVQPMLVPLAAAEGDRPVTCKRCLRLEANRAVQQQEAAALRAAADTSAIDTALAQATSVQDITAALEAGIAAADADTAAAAQAEIEEGHLDDAAAILTAASDTEAAEEAAERDAAEVQAQPAEVPAPRRARVNQKDLVLAFLAAHRGEDFTPHAISKAVTPAGTKALGLRDCLARLAVDGKVEIVGAKPATYRLILDAQYAEGLPADDAS